ncbi:hypothetical protein [Lentilactobacillus rapi]|nr:hypothetical protein [Lentilactobacillus rapi]
MITTIVLLVLAGLDAYFGHYRSALVDGVVLVALDVMIIFKHK